MPALNSSPANQKVLVSGANGFVAVWVVKSLLERGYSVRSTVRAEEKGRHLKEIFASYGEKHEIMIVSDITERGAFDEAVTGVDAIQHIASPVHIGGAHSDIITPAVQGTVGMLQSALDHGKSVKRIVITSSCAAVLHFDSKPQVFDENDWNEQCLEVLARGDSDPSVTMLVKYMASKTLAEKAVWKFWEEHQNEIKWDIVTLNPPYVFGPSMHKMSTPSDLNASSCAYVDVRDLAEAHALALEKPDAGSKRIIICAGVCKWQDFINAANAISPPPRLSQPLPVGNPGSGIASTTAVLFSYKTNRAIQILGLQYRSVADITKDILADFEARGW
ncbi:hypothetical protein BJ138DRAFT_1112243 [Hygrophoropsis aurantiaca]|uniref:Uncharacterized protein n=1 Tax=Hygrophoropsis aurantiaca TaxID=72124 RepID=A0ACB8AGQ3_9AGAM|nr:hypothetical protein BJ138DRAFT_1112243 [Hygrophoropsis aurantiaca]